MAEYKVTCVTTKHKSDTGITHIGSGSSRWTTEDAIRQLKARTTQFYTEVGGTRVRVVVSGSPPNEYLRTDPDKTTKNNLLELPNC